MNKLFIFFNFFIITALSSLDPLYLGDLNSQKFDTAKSYCEKKIDESIKLILDNRNGLLNCETKIRTE
jgi:hypothetical protein